MNKTCKIIMYHYVRPLQNSEFPKIKGLELKKFVNQINYFKEHYKFISVSEILDTIYKNQEIPDNSILLTFDDGLKDHYTYVFPVLKKFGIQGLFFPIGKTIDEKEVLDVHKIHFILAKCDNEKILVKDIFELINKNKNFFNLKSPEEYFTNLATPTRLDNGEIIFIKRILQRALPERIRSHIVNYLFKKYVKIDEQDFASELYLSHEEIKSMSENGMYFGSHSYSHPWLAFLDSKDLELELEQSHKFYSKINKIKKEGIMCYPYGNFDERVVAIIKKQGYKVGLTTEVGDAILNKPEAFTLKRFDTVDFLDCI